VSQSERQTSGCRRVPQQVLLWGGVAGLATVLITLALVLPPMLHWFDPPLKTLPCPAYCTQTPVGTHTLECQLFAKLNFDYNDWYQDHIKNKVWFYIVNILAIISAGMAAILVALGDRKHKPDASAEDRKHKPDASAEDRARADWNWKVLLVTLPALSATCGTVSIQFKMHDIWILRTHGVTHVEALWKEAVEAAADDKKIAEVYTKLQKIEEKQNTLEGML